MNDFVLRGFCQKCGLGVKRQFGRNTHIGIADTSDILKHIKWKNHRAKPVWFLSPNQMRIVCTSVEFSKWVIENNWPDTDRDEALAEYVDKFPFLVASILAKAGKEKGVEKNEF